MARSRGDWGSDEDAPLINQDSNAPLTVLELTPTSNGKTEEP